MTSCLEDGARARIAAFLPEILEKALQSYADFAGATAPMEEPKDFAAYHSACKTAIAHIDLLVKLARQVALEDTARAAESSKTDISAAILAATEEIESLG